jgi:hypothetical protein
MHNALVATIMSAFLFPGSGHLMLKHRTVGWSLMIGSLIPTIYLIHCIVNSALGLLTLIEKNLLLPEVPAMISYLMAHPFGENPTMAYYAIGIAGVIWLYAIVDSYRLGAQLDQRLRAEQIK